MTNRQTRPGLAGSGIAMFARRCGKILVCLLALAVTGCAGSAGIAPAPSAESYAFVNGLWFDGESFQPDTWYAVQGRLTRQRPPGLVQTVDLSDLYVVPPFGEAHNHNVEGPWNVQAVAQRYLQDGVFYVKNPNDVRDFALQIRHARQRADEHRCHLCACRADRTRRASCGLVRRRVAGRAV